MAKSSSKKNNTPTKVKKDVKYQPASKTPVKKEGNAADEANSEEASTTLPFSDPPLPTIDEFVKLYPRYNHIIVTVYQIVRDLHIKQEVTGIKILNGNKWNRKQYFIQCTTRSTGKERLMIPLGLDEEIDLPWIHKLTEEIEKKGMDLYICLHTPESIIYETLNTILP